MTHFIRCFAALSLVLFSLSGFADNVINECWAESTNHPQVYACLAQKVEAQQQALAQAYQKAEKSIQNFTPENATLAKNLLAGLRVSRQNFEQYQKTQCQFVMESAGGGSGAGDMKAGCMIDLMQGQIQLLENYMGAGS